MVLKQIKKISVIVSLLLAVLVQILIPNSAKQPETQQPYYLYFLYILGVVFIVVYIISFFI